MSASRRIAVYPGSFDPLTVGHLDILKRALALDVFDTVIVAVVVNPAKKALFTPAERMRMIEQALPREVKNGRVATDEFQGLLVDYARAKQACAIIRGLRAVSDYEYELQMAHMNRRLYPDAETLFLMAREEFSYVSSRLTKEVAMFGGEVKGLVPPHVYKAMREKFPAPGGKRSKR